MANTADSFASTILDNTSDYGDFGSDAEEAEILDLLLAEVESQKREDLAPSFRVTDIEDYEPPEGILVPTNDNVDTRQPSSQHAIEFDEEVIRENYQTASGMQKYLVCTSRY